MKRVSAFILWASAVLILGFFVLDFPYFQFQIMRALRPSHNVKTEVSSVPQESLVPNILTVPSLGIEAPVVYENATSSAVFESDLQKGVVHYPGTALPGQPGNCYIFGHSSDYVWVHGSYKTVFAALPSIKPGEEIKITDASGRQSTYIVDRTFVASPDDVALLKQDLGQHVLTLQTSYPLGTALKRFIVQAKLKN